MTAGTALERSRNCQRKQKRNRLPNRMFFHLSRRGCEPVFSYDRKPKPLFATPLLKQTCKSDLLRRIPFLRKPSDLFPSFSQTEQIRTRRPFHRSRSEIPASEPEFNMTRQICPIESKQRTPCTD